MVYEKVENLGNHFHFGKILMQFFRRIIIYQELFTHDSATNAEINNIIKRQRSPLDKEILSFFTLDESTIGGLDFMDIILSLVNIHILNK